MFNEKAFDINCKLKNKEKIKTFTLLNIDNSKIGFIDIEFAQKNCDKLNIWFQELIKVKLIRDYNKKIDILPHTLWWDRPYHPGQGGDLDLSGGKAPEEALGARWYGWGYTGEDEDMRERERAPLKAAW